MQIPKDLTSKKYPNFIRDNATRYNIKQERVFPKIGLKNYTSKVSIDKELHKESVKDYLTQLKSLLVNEVTNQSIYYGYDCVSLREFKSVIGKITDCLEKDPISFISNDGINIVLPFKLKAYDKLFKINEDLFEVLSIIKTTSLLQLQRMNSLFSNELNTFSMLKKDNLKIVFSGSGERCFWDIATMSMRGITSCQRWDNPHAKSLVGTIADPYAGIIYITNGEKLEYGSNMLKRSVIRFVVDHIGERPAILIERIYPHDYNGGLTDFITLSLFKQFIKKRTKNKFPVLYGEAPNHTIPMSSTIEAIPDHLYSYRDSKIGYKKFAKYVDVSSVSV